MKPLYALLALMLIGGCGDKETADTLAWVCVVGTGALILGLVATVAYSVMSSIWRDE